MNTLVLYHGGCPDGFCAAWVARRYLIMRGVEPVTDDMFVPISHNGEIPDVTGRNVVMLDICLRKERMLEIGKKANSLAVIDHHKTARIDLDSLPKDEIKDLAISFDMDRSGAGLTWDTLFPGEPRPWIVNYVEDRDTWRWKLPMSRQVSAFLRLVPFRFSDWDGIHRQHQDPFNDPIIITSGNAVLSMIQMYVEIVAKSAIEYRFEGYDLPLVNAASPHTSELLEYLAEQSKNGVAMSWHQGKDLRFHYSLRSTGKVDVSAWAWQYGGGGHAAAAGFDSSMPFHISGSW